MALALPDLFLETQFGMKVILLQLSRRFRVVTPALPKQWRLPGFLSCKLSNNVKLSLYTLTPCETRHRRASVKVSQSNSLSGKHYPSLTKKTTKY